MELLVRLLPRCSHLLTHIDFGEAEGAEVRVGTFHRRLNRLSEQFVHELADKRPHLFDRLGEDRNVHFSSVREALFPPSMQLSHYVLSTFPNSINILSPSTQVLKVLYSSFPLFLIL